MNDVNKEFYEKVKQIYPDMGKFSIKDYNEINNDIICNINNKNRTKQIVKKFYNKLLVPLGYFASLYARFGLDEDSFTDALSGFYLDLIEKFDEKLDKSEWYPSFYVFSARLHRIATQYIEKCLHTNSYIIRRTKSLRDGTVSDLPVKGDSKNMRSNQELITIKQVSLDYLDEDLPENSYEIMEEVFKDLLKSIMKSEIGKLSAKEIRITNLYFGLEQDKPLKIQAIADKYNISRETVRRILVKVLIKLRNPTISKNFEDFKC